MRRIDTRRCVLASAGLGGLALALGAAAEFRTIDGTGNNTFQPAWGAADTRIIRFGYNADYPDILGDAIDFAGKPNPRDVSNAVLAQTGSILNDRGLSDFSVHWGQFLTHDLTLIETDPAANVLSDGSTGDFSIPVNTPGDPLGPGPIAFDRSVFDPATGIIDNSTGVARPVPRVQINSVTSFIDASNVYGSDTATADALRTFSGGRLATSAGGLLPGTDGAGDYLAGDTRANENVGLTAIHALFVREHNRLADLIQTNNPGMSDEDTYQWARKIVGAEMQAITYNQYLPAILGDAAPAAEDFNYTGIDASITSAFSTAAFRFGHSMQSNELLLVDDTGNTDTLSLAAASENPAFLTDDPGNVERLLRGLTEQTAQENDVYLVDDLRTIPFGPPGAGGTDLGAADIQRGRDHGLLSSNNRHRIAYNLAPLQDFAALTADPAVQAALASVYDSVDEVDAWVAMIAEDHQPGSSVGALAEAILVSQFSRLRDGDRFFFTADPDLDNPIVTSIIDLDAITLANLIELNTGITGLQANVFFVPEPATAAFMLTSLTLLRRRRV